MRRARDELTAAASDSKARPAARSEPDAAPFPEPPSEAPFPEIPMPPMAAASALPIAVLVLEIRMFPFWFCFFCPKAPVCPVCPPAFPAAALSPSGEAAFFRSAAFFCICRTSSMVSPSLSKSFMAAS